MSWLLAVSLKKEVKKTFTDSYVPFFPNFTYAKKNPNSSTLPVIFARLAARVVFFCGLREAPQVAN